MKNPDIERKFENLINRDREIHRPPEYNLDALSQNDAPYYNLNLPDYDFSSLGIIGLQSLFMNLTAKLEDAESCIKLETNYTERIRLINERAILKKTISAVEQSLIDKKRKEVMDYLEQQRLEELNRGSRIQAMLQADNDAYDDQRKNREKELSEIKDREVNKLKTIRESLNPKTGKTTSSSGRKSQLDRAESIKKKATKLAEGNSDVIKLVKTPAKSGTKTTTKKK